MEATSFPRRLSAMYAAGVQTAGRRLGTIFALYGVNALFTLTFTVGAAFYLSSVYAQRPLFDRAVDGDFGALVVTLREGGVTSGLAWSGVGLALLYFVVSQYLAGGLLERLRDDEAVTRAEARRRFGAGGAAHLGRFVRIWLWTWLLWVPTIIATAIGLWRGTRGLGDAVAFGTVLGPLVLTMLPALLLGTIAASAGDYARVLAVRDPALAPRRAVFAALKLVLRRPETLLHFASYVAAWLFVGGLYVLMTFGYSFSGAGGAWLLFVVRQLIVFARVALRVGAYAGQKALVDA